MNQYFMNRGVLSLILGLFIYIILISFSLFSVYIAFILLVLFLLSYCRIFKINYLYTSAIFIITSLQGVYLLYNFSPIIGVDESIFYNQLINSSFKDLFLKEYNRLIEVGGFIRSRTTFSALLNLVIPFDLKEHEPSFIFIVNYFFWYIAVSFYVTSLKSHLNKDIVNILYFFLLISPSILFWSSNFGKDIFSISLSLLSASFLLKKNYILFLIFLLSALSIRPYAIVMIYIYTAPFIFSLRSICVALFLILGILSYISNFNLFNLINVIISFVYMFFSPNPLNIENWQSYTNLSNQTNFSLTLTLEGAFISLVAIISLFFKKNILFIKLIICILIGSTILSMVGYLRIVALDLPYSIGFFGDNFVRKKTIVYPLIYVLVSISVYNIKNKLYLR